MVLLLKKNSLLLIGVTPVVGLWFVEPYLTGLLNGHSRARGSLIPGRPAGLWHRVLLEGVLILFLVYAQLTVNRRRRAQEDRMHLAAFVESSNDAIVGGTLDGIITSVNASAERAYGYPAEELVGRHISVFVPEDRGHEVDEILDSVRSGDGVWGYETIRLKKGGRGIQVSLTSSPVRDPRGDIVGSSTTYLDVTKRRRAGESLRRSEERLRNLLENAGDAIFVHDLGGRFVDVNQRACESLGYTREELLGLCVQDVEQNFTGDIEEMWQRVSPG